MDARSERVAQRFEVPMLVAAALVVPALVLEGASWGEPWPTVGRALNWAIWIAFLVELVVMLAVVPDRRRWARRHPLEIAVVVLTPPFAAGALQSIRVLRLLRLVRLLRLGPLVRRVFTVEGVRYVSLVAVLFVLGGAQAYHDLEGGSFDDGVYWAIGTMTTVGFAPPAETDAGQIVAIVLVLAGVAFVAILTGAIAQRFLAPAVSEIQAAEEELEQEEREVIEEVRDIAARLTRLEEALERRARRAGSPPRPPPSPR